MEKLAQRKEEARNLLNTPGHNTTCNELALQASSDNVELAKELKEMDKTESVTAEDKEEFSQIYNRQNKVSEELRKGSGPRWTTVHLHRPRPPHISYSTHEISLNQLFYQIN